MFAKFAAAAIVVCALAVPADAAGPPGPSPLVPKKWGAPRAYATVDVNGRRHLCFRWLLKSKPGPTVADVCRPWPVSTGS